MIKEVIDKETKMLYIYKPAYYIFQFLVLLALGCVMLFGCQKNTEKPNSDKTNLSMEIHFIQEYYSPLDATRYNAVLNDVKSVRPLYQFAHQLCTGRMMIARYIEMPLEKFKRLLKSNNINLWHLRILFEFVVNHRDKGDRYI